MWKELERSEEKEEEEERVKEEEGRNKLEREDLERVAMPGKGGAWVGEVREMGKNTTTQGKGGSPCASFPW